MNTTPIAHSLYQLAAAFSVMAAILSYKPAFADSTTQATAIRIEDGRVQLGADRSATVDANMARTLARDVSALREHRTCADMRPSELRRTFIWTYDRASTQQFEPVNTPKALGFDTSRCN